MNLETGIVNEYLDTEHFRELALSYSTSMIATDVLSPQENVVLKLSGRIEAEILDAIKDHQSGLAQQLLTASLGNIDFEALALSFME